jgi:phosphatidylinositol glycan class B
MIASLWQHHRTVLIVALALHLSAALLSVGYYAADEHFQILEFAGLKLGINQPEDLPWEYPTRMRPALQPAMAYAAIKALSAVGIRNPFDQVTFLRLVSALASLLGIFLLIRAFIPEFTSERLKRWLVYLSLLLWFMPFQHVRFCSETWSGLAFFMGLALLWPAVRDRDQNAVTPDLAIGLLFGASFLFRYQAGIWVAALFLWLLIRRHNQAPRLIRLATGSLLAIGVGVLIDRWFYGAWTLTAWNYLKLNLISPSFIRTPLCPSAPLSSVHSWCFGFVARAMSSPGSPWLFSACTC